MADYSELMKLEKKQKPSPLPVITPSEQTQPASYPANQQTSRPGNQETDKETNQQTSEPVSQKTDLLANQQTSEPVNQEDSKEANEQISKPTNQQTSKQLRKIGSYLREDSLKALKQIAVLTDRKDYEILQDAVDFYLAHKGNR
jgi:hypothetical protein